jgi:hypothetical protein
MSLTLIGDCTFTESTPAAPAKNDWGVDILIRKFTGAQSLRAAFEATLEQGQTYVYNGITYYLQTWSWDDRVAVSTVTLNYKGLHDGVPPEVVINEIVGASGSTSADFTLGGTRPQGIVYGQDAAGKDLYAIGAQMEFTYLAGQTLYRYISNGQPDGPSHSTLGFTYTPIVKRARVSTSDGATFGLLSPLAIGPALEPAVITRAVGFGSQPIFGTPYFECQDTVRTDLGIIGA